MIELVPANYFAPLDLSEIFGRTAPVELDVGCGDGAYLIALAEAQPERDFLGLEKLYGRTQVACRKAMRRGSTNVRILRVESSYALRYLLPPQSVARIHLLFPDPWPKKRHQRRRIVKDEFLRDVQIALELEGIFHVATDDADYFQEITRASERSAGFVVANPCEIGPLPPTTFEKHFRKTGAKIYGLLLRKVSPARNGSA